MNYPVMHIRQAMVSDSSPMISAGAKLNASEIGACFSTITSDFLIDPCSLPHAHSSAISARLGRSIQNVLSCVPESRPSEKSELHSFAGRLRPRWS